MGGPFGAPAKLAPWPLSPALCQARGELWPGCSLRGELLSRRDGVANQGGDSLLGGGTGEMAPRVWRILWKRDLLDGRHLPDARPGWLNSGENCRGWGVMGILGVPGVSEAGGARVPE